MKVATITIIVDLVFNNFNRVSTFFADVNVVKPEPCHPPTAIEIPLDVHKFLPYFEQSYRQYALGDYSRYSLFSL